MLAAAGTDCLYQYHSAEPMKTEQICITTSTNHKTTIIDKAIKTHEKYFI